jgi:hypothetical protein
MVNHLRRALAFSQALVLGVALLPAAAGAQTVEPELVKTWAAAGSGIVKLVIASTPAGATVTAWGSCHPTPCAWGTRPLMAFAPNVSAKLARVGMAEYKTSFTDTWLIASLAGPDALSVQTFTHFTDRSGRSNYVQTVVMH